MALRFSKLRPYVLDQFRKFRSPISVILNLLKTDISFRTGTLRRAGASAGVLLRWGVVLAMGTGGYWAMRLAWADHLSYGALWERERAIKLFPAAAYYERLADKRDELGGDPLPDLRQAVARDSSNGSRWMRLGLRAEMAGDYPLAEQSLLRAAALSRLYQPRFLLAQYYFRRQNADGFIAWARAAIDTSYGDISSLLDLCWRMRPDGAWLAAIAPDRPEVTRQVLLFLVRKQQFAEALPIALKLSRYGGPEDLPALLDYCEHAISDDSSGGALQVWNALCNRGLLPCNELQRAAGNSLTDGHFEHLWIRQGFAWRFTQSSWLSVRASRSGPTLTLTGEQPEECMIAWQYLPLVPQKRYRVRLEAHPVDAPSAEGLDWEVYDLAGKPVLTEVHAGWTLFKAPSAITRLALVYRRPLGTVRLSGSVALTGAEFGSAP